MPVDGTEHRLRCIDATLGLIQGPPDDDPPLPPASAPPAPHPEPGAVLSADGEHGECSGMTWDDFAIGDLIGRGGMGEVYLAWQRSLGREVAFKVLPGATGGDAELRRRFADEARAAGRLHSPHAVAVIASGAHDGTPWLAMEYVRGTSLANLLAERRAAGAPLPPREALELARQAARGLADAHRERLVHRDLKPANLLLGADGTLKIADFGLVRFLDARTMTVAGTVLGTPQYAAPEQLRGLPTDARSDLYSLGAVLYELLTLRPPFDGDSAEALIFQHNFAEPPLPTVLNPDVPQDLQAVCLKCLQKDPARRFADADALLADLDRLTDGLAPRSAVFAPGEIGTGAEDALRRLAPRRRRWPLLAGMASVMLVLAAGWAWWDARKSEIASLRARLAPLAQTAAVPGTAGDDLRRLAALAGAGDGQVAQGLAKLQRIDTLAGRLDALGRTTTGTGAAAAGRADLAALAEEVGPGGDPRMPRWSAAIAMAEGRLAELRARLAPRLDGQDLLTANLREAVGRDLEAFLALADGDDPDRIAWSALARRSAAAMAAARAALARLGSPQPLVAADLQRLRGELDRLRLLDPADPLLPDATRRLDGDAAELARQQAVVAKLGRDADAGSRAAAAEALAWLERRDAIAPEEARSAHDLLAETEAELAALAGRLAILDAPRTLPPGIAGDLRRFTTLAGYQDPRAAAWWQRLSSIQALLNRLEPLGRSAPIPPGAERDLDGLARLVGGDDPQVAAWTAKLAAIRELRGGLAALDAVGPAPAGASDGVARLAALVGPDDAEVRRWSGRLATEQRLRGELLAWESACVLPLQDIAAARDSLAAWRGLVGDEELGRRAARRLGELTDAPATPWAVDRGHDRHGPWSELAIGGIRQRLRWLPPVLASIGSDAGETGHEDDEARLAVRLSGGRWIADSECTQELWQAVMGTEPARNRGRRLPVEQVTAGEAEEFCRRLATVLPGCAARLPSEAEWEAAARAGIAGAWGGLPADQAARTVVHAGATAAVAVDEGLPNPLGLWHMAGNVGEWCRDAYAPLPAGDLVVDPIALGAGRRVVKGGSWGDSLEHCRFANRTAVEPGRRSPCLGFRFVVDPVGKE